jgi:hypothetical protein
MSTASGRLMAVPGTALSSDALISFGWPTNSDNLVAELSFTTKVQLTSWPPGAARLAVAVLRPRQSSASLVIGQYLPSVSKTGTCVPASRCTSAWPASFQVSGRSLWDALERSMTAYREVVMAAILRGYRDR